MPFRDSRAVDPATLNAVRALGFLVRDPPAIPEPLRFSGAGYITKGYTKQHTAQVARRARERAEKLEVSRGR